VAEETVEKGDITNEALDLVKELGIGDHLQEGKIEGTGQNNRVKKGDVVRYAREELGIEPREVGGRREDGRINIPDHQITGPDSFKAVTQGDPRIARLDRRIAGLYGFFLLDCLICLAHRVSLDFIKRPQLYTELGDGVSLALGKLRARYGCHEEFLSKPQRDEIYVPIFGQSYGINSNLSTSNVSTGSATAREYDFPTLSHQLIEATAKFSEGVFYVGAPMLRDSIKRAHILFKEFLHSKQGASVRWSMDEALSKLTNEIAYPILRDRGVANVFGVNERPDSRWPYVEDAQGSKLVEAIYKKLMKDEPGMPPLTEGQFIDLQETALRGAEAIATVIDFDIRDHEDEDAQDVLITKVYTWGTMLRGLQAGSIARWQEPTFSGAMVGGAVPNGDGRS
jgi:hypothetical protein